MNLPQLQSTRDKLWDVFWDSFFTQLTHSQRISWGQRKKEMESLFKKAWDSGAGTVLDLINEAVQNRPRIISSSQTRPEDIERIHRGRK